jgi:hypothetical protein
MPHYFAPHVALLLLLVLRGVRVLSAWKFRGGRPAAHLANAIILATVGALMCSGVLSSQKPSRDWDAFARERDAILTELLQRPGDDLILVRYAPRHFVHSEWVFNLSDIDRQPVIWARELTPGQNAELLRYYEDRKVWLLEPDARPPRIVPYPASRATAAR